ncbi:MAG: hypothetical protein K6G28_02035 [Acholeplasmatales bacterium]|nr:hypothetical protein [Acholeplasmatales bacterium]
MSKAYYNNLTFDSEWEKDYYLHLLNDLKINENNIWRNIKPFTDLMARKKYTPDMIYYNKDEKKFYIVEIKGNYNPFANHFQDEMIHKEMKAKTQDELRHYVIENGIETYFDDTFQYIKIKYLKAHGWVDYDWKNPNTRVSQQKAKINDLSVELKELKAFKKDTIRYWKLFIKSIAEPKKVTKSQEEFMDKYSKEINEYLKEESKK